MGQPSKAGAVLVFLFGLPFFGFGLFFAFAMLSSSPATHKSGDPIAGALFGLVFALIGLGLMVGAIYGYQKQKQDAATREANPDSPWLWRADWGREQSLKPKPKFADWLVDWNNISEHDCGLDHDDGATTANP